MDQYKNADGTYTSPKNNKVYKSLKAFTAHWHYAGTANSDTFRQRLSKVCCKFCNKDIIISSIRKHETSCYLNPDNMVNCAVCNTPIKKYKQSKGTCSHSCANTLFRTGENHGNWKPDRYRTTCFAHHERKCVVCGEDKIIEVHHLDHNKQNNDPSNLIPMCPTHHQYWHSRYKNIIEDAVLNYIARWKNKLSMA